MCCTFFSTITTWGPEGELGAFRNMLKQFPTGLMSVVSDSYDVWNACEKVCHVFMGAMTHNLNRS